MIWKYMDNYDTVWKMGNDLEKSGQFDTVLKMGNEFEKSGQF